MTGTYISLAIAGSVAPGQGPWFGLGYETTLRQLRQPGFEDSVAQTQARGLLGEARLDQDFLAVEALPGLGFEQQDVAVETQ